MVDGQHWKLLHPIEQDARTIAIFSEKIGDAGRTLVRASNPEKFAKSEHLRDAADRAERKAKPIRLRVVKKGGSSQNPYATVRNVPTWFFAPRSATIGESAASPRSLE